MLDSNQTGIIHEARRIINAANSAAMEVPFFPPASFFCHPGRTRFYTGVRCTSVLHGLTLDHSLKRRNRVFNVSSCLLSGRNRVTLASCLRSFQLLIAEIAAETVQSLSRNRTAKLHPHPRWWINQREILIDGKFSRWGMINRIFKRGILLNRMKCMNISYLDVWWISLFF